MEFILRKKGSKKLLVVIYDNNETDTFVFDKWEHAYNRMDLMCELVKNSDGIIKVS